MSHLPHSEMNFSADAGGAGNQASRARAVSSEITAAMIRSARNIATDAELVYQEHAPRRTGRLARGIRATALGDQVVVTATAVDPKTGFDYVGVTRFGHRKALIVPVTKRGKPRKSRSLRRNLSGQFISRGAGFLVFTSRGRLWRLRSVRGFRPIGDWTDRALPEIRQVADTEMDQTGNKITVAWGG